MSNIKNLVWSEKWRPSKLDECILSEPIKKLLKDQIGSGKLSNYLFSGGAGIGKTTAAYAIAKELDADILYINASLDSGIDTLRTKITQFVSTVSFTNSRKIVLLDEGDYLNCFSGSQEIILSDNKVISLAKLEDLLDQEVNLLSYNFKTKLPEESKAVVFVSGEKELFEVELEDGSRMVCTEDHPFFDQAGNAATIHSGSLFVVNSDMLKIVSIKSVGVQKVYDVTTESENHNFLLSNGVVAHNCTSTQPALRGFMDTFSDNATFIITCNYPNRIIAPLHSRLSHVEFKFTKEEKKAAAMQMMQRIFMILESEKIGFDKKTIAGLITRNFPDFRRTLVELQRYSSSGVIDSGILASIEDTGFDELTNALKEKSFVRCRQWVANNTMESTQFYRMFYDKMSTLLQPASVPQMILLLADFGFKATHSVDQEINSMAFLVTFMQSCQFK